MSKLRLPELIFMMSADAYTTRWRVLTLLGFASQLVRSGAD